MTQAQSQPRYRARWNLRPPHANPIVEHVFRRFEEGATLTEIGRDILDDRFTDHPAQAAGRNQFGVSTPARDRYRSYSIEDHTARDFMERLVLSTVAPGTEYQQALQDMPDDLSEPQNKAMVRPFVRPEFTLVTGEPKEHTPPTENGQ